MGHEFSKDDIFLLRAGFGTQDGNACAMLVFENGWGLLIEQDDLNPAEIPLKDTKFRLTTKRTSTLPFNKTPELCNTSSHPITSMEREYEKRGFTLEQVAAIATQLSALEPIGEYSTEEIVDYALEQGPYRPSQIENRPISTSSGMELDADELRAQIQAGKLRNLSDYESPLKFELFYKDADILLIPNGNGSPYFPTNILLPTGHVLGITSKGIQKNPRFDVTTLIPDETLKLHPTFVKGIDNSTLEASWRYAVRQGGEAETNHLPYSENNPTITGINLWEVRNIANDLIKRRTIVEEGLVPKIAIVNAGTSYAITQFNGEKYDPYTGQLRDLFSRPLEDWKTEFRF